MSTVDVEKLLQSEDPHDWVQVWDAYTWYKLVTETLRETEGSAIPGDLMRRRCALTLLERTHNVPVVTALDALRATRQFADLEVAGRWQPMMEARESGASWEQIADAARVAPAHLATGDPGADTRAWYALRVAAEAECGRLAGALKARAYAVLDEAEPAVPEPVVPEAPVTEGQAADEPPDGEAEA